LIEAVPSPAAVPPGVSLVWLDGAAIDAVEHLHRCSIDGVDAGLVKPERRSFFESVFGGRGEVIGAVGEGGDDGRTRIGAGRLIAYGVLLTTLAEGEDAGERLGRGDNRGLAKIAGTGVDPHERGRGLQRCLVRRRVARAAERGFDHVFATAAPGNTVSWRNLMTEGFAVADMVLAYGRLERLLLHRPTAAPAAGPAAPTVWCRADRSDDIRAAVAAGLAGTHWRDGGAPGTLPPEIGFGPADGGRR